MQTADTAHVFSHFFTATLPSSRCGRNVTPQVVPVGSSGLEAGRRPPLQTDVLLHIRVPQSHNHSVTKATASLEPVVRHGAVTPAALTLASAALSRYWTGLLLHSCHSYRGTPQYK
ncbi:hypothetical protein EYF80_056443 [Liparis tanakae]|uniref:Uncharacterized protein n=1 Tax=Liparis tanakae TaxID=230148 RepID=A0A4Z2EX43_9TELE|nr:hypothetical protein EYF80_056443 [Liparis tanakae]